MTPPSTNRLGGFINYVRNVDWRSRDGRRILAGFSAALVAVAAVLIVIAVRSQQSAPQPPRSAAAALTGSASRSAAKAAASSARSATKAKSAAKKKAKKKPFVARSASGSVPVEIDIPALDVQANVVELGLNADRTVQVPPLSQVGEAGWYKYSPVPGQIGPSVILGHIDSATAGRGVFFSLGALRAGAVVSIVRADHMVATFSVTRVAEYPKSAFPTQAIYGNTSGPALRLITCGGKFDPSKHSYVDNIVAFATLTSLKHQ